MKRCLALALIPLALFVAGVLMFAPSESKEPRTSLEVMGAFVYHLDKGNFGKACGLYADEARATVEMCSEGFIYTAGQHMGFFGVDPFDGARISPSSEKIISETRVSYEIVTDVIPPATATLEKQDSGRWRIVSIR